MVDHTYENVNNQKKMTRGYQSVFPAKAHERVRVDGDTVDHGALPLVPRKPVGTDEDPYASVRRLTIGESTYVNFKPIVNSP